MNHNYNQLDLQTALAYDRQELKSKSFQPEERWIINMERTRLMQSNKFEIKSTLSKSILETLNKILRQVELLNWEVDEPTFNTNK